MKKIFIETKYNQEIKLDSKQIEKLPKKIGLVSTIQFIDSLSVIKATLIKSNKKVIIGKGIQKYPGQVLGCDVSSAIKIQNKVDAFLFIGGGNFHPLEITLRTKKPLFQLNNNQLNKIDDKEIERIEKKKKGAYIKFLTSKNIGILVSTKPGQNKLKQAISLKNKLKDKNCYLLIADTIDVNGLENFNFIDCFVNTACPRLREDLSCVNIDDLGNI